MTTPPFTLGAHHIGLTVPDLDQTKAFFEGALGFQQVGEVPDYPAVFISDGTVMLTLWREIRKPPPPSTAGRTSACITWP